MTYIASATAVTLIVMLGLAVAHPLTTIRLADRAITRLRHRRHQAKINDHFRLWELECSSQPEQGDSTT